jgi:hypothetical protein
MNDEQEEQGMASKRKELGSTDDLKASIAHVDQVSARIARLLADLSAPKPTAGPDGTDHGSGSSEQP